MSFHKKQRERQFNTQLRRINDETPAEEAWRCPAFFAVALGGLFYVVLVGGLLGYYLLVAPGGGDGVNG